jgi:hypothetical protein
LGFCKEQFSIANFGFVKFRLAEFTQAFGVIFINQFVDSPKADIMPGFFISVAGVSQTNY